jgi:hypothetical protein
MISCYDFLEIIMKIFLSHKYTRAQKHYLYSKSHKSIFIPIPKMIYKFLTIVICIYACQNKLKENTNKTRELCCTNFEETQAHFATLVEEGEESARDYLV